MGIPLAINIYYYFIFSNKTQDLVTFRRIYRCQRRPMIAAIALMGSLQHINLVHMKPVVIVTHSPTVYCHSYIHGELGFFIDMFGLFMSQFDYTQMISFMQWGLAMLLGICDRIISHNWRFSF